jgi:hypothetical protein
MSQCDELWETNGAPLAGWSSRIRAVSRRRRRSWLGPAVVLAVMVFSSASVARTAAVDPKGVSDQLPLAGVLSHRTELTVAKRADYPSLGTAVAMSSDGRTAIVGAPERAVGNQFDAGAAEVYTLTGGKWRGPVELRLVRRASPALVSVRRWPSTATGRWHSSALPVRRLAPMEAPARCKSFAS